MENEGFPTVVSPVSRGSKSKIGKISIKGVIIVVLVSIGVYFMIDAQSVVDSYVYVDTPSIVNTKENFKQLFNNYYYNTDEVSYDEYVGDISIDTALFSEDSVRLNTEIFAVAQSIFNKEHVLECLGEPDCKFEEDFVEYLDPIMVLAITYPETGSMSDSRYTWCSGIYSKPLLEAGVDMSTLHVTDVTVDVFQNVPALKKYLYCGGGGYGCTASSAQYHVHYNTTGTASDVQAYNDNDSLGPLQILRRYVEAAQGAPYEYESSPGNAGITYKCGRKVTDLIQLEHSLVYNFHNHTGNFMYVQNNSELCDKSINNATHLAVMLGVSNNTGAGWLSTSNAGVQPHWKSTAAIYDYTYTITQEKYMDSWQSIIDQWYVWYLDQLRQGKSPCLAGDSGYYRDYSIEVDGNVYRCSQPYEIAEIVCGIRTMDIVGEQESVSPKVSYAVRMLLNYLALERLYYSGL